MCAAMLSRMAVRLVPVASLEVASISGGFCGGFTAPAMKLEGSGG
jgi:hypothetical protein